MLTPFHIVQCLAAGIHPVHTVERQTPGPQSQLSTQASQTCTPVYSLGTTTLGGNFSDFNNFFQMVLLYLDLYALTTCYFNFAKIQSTNNNNFIICQLQQTLPLFKRIPCYTSTETVRNKEPKRPIKCAVVSNVLVQLAFDWSVWIFVFYDRTSNLKSIAPHKHSLVPTADHSVT